MWSTAALTCSRPHVSWQSPHRDAYSFPDGKWPWKARNPPWWPLHSLLGRFWALLFFSPPPKELFWKTENALWWPSQSLIYESSDQFSLSFFSSRRPKSLFSFLPLWFSSPSAILCRACRSKRVLFVPFFYHSSPLSFLWILRSQLIVFLSY